MITYDIPNTSVRDKIHAIVKNFEEALPDHFEKTDLEKCGKCNGSGLDVTPSTDDTLTIWNPGAYCKNCRGFGYLGIDRIYNAYVCLKCDGKGCKTCNDTGMIDWIKRAMG